jgi:hypothetical protein
MLISGTVLDKAGGFNTTRIVAAGNMRKLLNWISFLFLSLFSSSSCILSGALHL